MKKFWNWKAQDQNDGEVERVLEFYGTIAEVSWFDDDITPEIFKEELHSGQGPVTVLINSPGGDCIAASQIYSMLQDYPGVVTVKIDGLAASAASVIAMAGDKVLMASTALMMIHNPATVAFGDHNEMSKAIAMLEEVKESIINAYEKKSGLSRSKLSHLMEAETWMNAKKAIELGLADGMTGDEKAPVSEAQAYAFSRRAAEKTLVNKITAKFDLDRINDPDEDDEAVPFKAPVLENEVKPTESPVGRSVDALMERLFLLSH